MDIQDDTTGKHLSHTETPAEHIEVSSPKPRKKRVAINSPEVTPPQLTIPTDMEVDNPSDHTTIKPTVLVHRFTNSTVQEEMTPAQVKAKVASDQWKEVWDHPQILAELTAEPVPPTPGEVLPYEFDQEDATTMKILLTLNGAQLETHM